MKNIIFLDIDGTLIDCFNSITRIAPQVREAIRLLQLRGDYVFIATGRPYAFLDREILELGFDGFILANGAHVIINNETIYSNPISNGFVKELASNFDKKNIQYTLNGRGHSYMKRENKEFYDFFQKANIHKKAFKNDYSLDEIDVYKVEILCQNNEITNHCLNFIKNYPEYDYFSSVSSMHLEFYFKENTKATGIQKALEHLNIPLENTYAIGDGKNDIEMLGTVGYGIAMGNATEEVKKYAKAVTDTVQNNGVATGIKKYILKK
ncbi:MAG: HAD family hydrolase [Fusobacteriaceae bacterium]